VKAVVQRISQGSVRINPGGSISGAIGRGLLVLVAAHRQDSEANVTKMADRILKLRIFNDQEGKMNLALRDLDPPGEVLIVSNFTVYGETAKNRRPSFVESAPYERGEALFNQLLVQLRETGLKVETGVFGASMDVALVNDGPVTVILET
jgi:D-tyrosyl-tRNA(Tyr) deacylase